MAHDELFDPDDPVLARIRAIALGFPGAAEKISHGRPAFYTKKVFVYYGGSVRRGAGDWIQHPQSVMVRLDADERAALLDDPRTFIPAYLGSSGWLGIDLEGESDFDEVAELIDSSYRTTAPTQLVMELDAGPA
jgi:predicted DNA-binding protein (MmcQ/YjbR family)